MALGRAFLRRGGALILTALCACGSTDGTLGESPTLIGQFQDWNGGSGKMLVAGTLTGVTLASAPITADGSFSITLPGRDVVAAALDETAFQDPCPAQGSAVKTILSCESSITPKSAPRAELKLSIPGLTQTITHEARSADQTAEFPSHSVLYEYWDGAVDFTAQLVFREQQTRGPVTVTTKWDLHYQPGWNSTIYYQPTPADAANGMATLRFVTERPSSSFAWYCCTN